MTRIRPRPARGGTIMPLLGLCLIALFAFVGLAVDLGVLAVARTQCQNAADVAALVGARNLNNAEGVADTNRAAALAAARAAAKANPKLNAAVADADISTVVAGQYKYNPGSQRFAVGYPSSVSAGDSWSAVRVELAVAQPTYFMRVLGVASMPTGATAVAVHRPRDMAFVLDFTGSMTFGSTPNWPYYIGGGSAAVEGLMNPDPAYPQFGHYGRYVHYQTDNASTSAAGSSTVTSRPNPLQMKDFIQNTDGGYAPNNHTMTSTGGPPMVEDFITAPGDPATVSPSTTTKNAFKMWSPTQTAPPDTTTLTPATWSWSGYDASTAACPAPDNFATQSDSPVAYVGDKWPRTNGTRGAQASAWATLSGGTFTDNAAKTVKEFIYYSPTGTGGRDLTRYTLPATTGLPTAYASSLPAAGSTADALLPTSAQRSNNKVDGGTTDASYYDAIWERYGYDLDVADLRGQASSNKTVRLSADRFQGYSMGPGYWGKTFFVWPPDPRFGVYDSSGNVTLPTVTSPDPNNPAFDTSGRPMCDWRRRFFLRGDGAAFDPQSDDINQILFGTSAGHVLNTVRTTVATGYSASNCPGYYRINYAAVVAWLKSGPQVLPTNLRSGRILYYSSLPADLTTTAAGNSDDKTFWREYVHYILGVGQFSTSAPLTGADYTPANVMAGVEGRFPFGTLSRTDTATFTPGGFGKVANPKPYMTYTDNVNRPRMHFWFGPHSMLHFLRRAGLDRPWWSGTTHEAQCWQLKAAISSVLDDMRKNHPNDYCGIAGFATRNHFNTPLANMSQDWYTLKNVLFFRKDTVADMKANLVAGSNPPTTTSTLEHRPYDSSFDNSNTDMIPNAANGTDPNSGLAAAFNMFSANATYGYGGRKGASKVVVFETDGMPNNTRKWFVTGTGDATRYTYNSGSSSNPPAWAGDTTINSQARYAVEVVKNIVAPVSATAQSGYSLPNAPARVYAIGFGDIFTGYDGTNYGSMSSTQQGALKFLLRVQQVGGTSPAGNPPAVPMPAENIITGDYESRITKLKSTLERIAQSGVQVTLIE